MKYKTLLHDYIKKLDPSHADFEGLNKAIEQYSQVVGRNNMALEHKEKSVTLVSLDEKFGNIISN